MSRRLYIGDLAKATGRSVHTIRWYEAQGLIPRVDRDGGGRRIYEEGHVDHLVFLDRMRQAGMSVADLRRLTELGLMGWRTLPDRQALLLAHREEIEGRIDDLMEALRLIDQKVAFYAEWAERKKRPPPPH